MQGVLLLVFSKFCHLPFLRGVQRESTRTGLGGYWVCAMQWKEQPFRIYYEIRVGFVSVGLLGWWLVKNGTCCLLPAECVRPCVGVYVSVWPSHVCWCQHHPWLLLVQSPSLWGQCSSSRPSGFLVLWLSGKKTSSWPCLWAQIHLIHIRAFVFRFILNVLKTRGEILSVSSFCFFYSLKGKQRWRQCKNDNIWPPGVLSQLSLAGSHEEPGATDGGLWNYPATAAVWRRDCHWCAGPWVGGVIFTHYYLAILNLWKGAHNATNEQELILENTVFWFCFYNKLQYLLQLHLRRPHYNTELKTLLFNLYMINVLLLSYNISNIK